MSERKHPTPAHGTSPANGPAAALGAGAASMLQEGVDRVIDAGRAGVASVREFGADIGLRDADDVSQAARGAANLIVNADFSAGATSFTSAYTNRTGSGFPALFNEATYVITSDPSEEHENAASYFDHTSGNDNGAMMAVNGAASNLRQKEKR